MNNNILVRNPRELTVAWAQRVVNCNSNDAVVSRVEIISVDIGTTTRVRILVEHNGPDTLPRRWFVKLPSLDWRARLITALPRLLQTEVRFYSEISDAIPMIRPSILAAQSRFGRGATLVLNDVTEFGANPGSPMDELTVSQADLIVEQLAYLHAHFWHKLDISNKHRWLAGPVRRLEDFLGTLLAVPLMKRGLRRAGSVVPLHLHDSAIHYARHRRKTMRFLAKGVQTLVHHDCHPGNFFWHKSQPGLLDWQLVRTGEGISDIAYFLATALSPETRQIHEASLLSKYVQILSENGVQGVDHASQLHRYRAHLVYPFEAMLVTLAVGGMMDLQSNMELIRRTAAAVEDLDTFAVIESVADCNSKHFQATKSVG